MPKTDDQKPRMRVRRTKFQESLNKRRGLRLSFRSFRRGELCRVYLKVVAAQKKIEMELRRQGVNWRTVEQAVANQVQGKWRRLDEIYLPTLGCKLRDHFAKLEEKTVVEKELVTA